MSYSINPKMPYNMCKLKLCLGISTKKRSILDVTKHHPKKCSNENKNCAFHYFSVIVFLGHGSRGK